MQRKKCHIIVKSLVITKATHRIPINPRTMSTAKKMKMQLDNGCSETGSVRITWHHQHHTLGYAMKLKNALKTRAFLIIKNVNVKHCVSALILLTLGTIIYYTHYVDNSPFIG